MIAKSDFSPLWYLRNRHLQTLAANLVHPPEPDVTYETLALPDGDTLDLAHGATHGTSCVLILHGLEGSLRSAYAQRLMNALHKQHISAKFMFFRGCNGKPNNSIRSYHSGETSDLRAVIQHLKNAGMKHIALVGYSLGGNVTLKYMGEQATDESVVCAAAISVPLLLDVCARRMNKGFSRVYQQELMNRLKQKVRQKKSLLMEAGYLTDPDLLKNFVDFDNAFTAPVHGYEDAGHYYHSCSSRQFLKGIDKPTLIIHSRDDPFMTPEVIPQASELSDSIRLELSSHGGHVGFISGGFIKPEYWLEKRILQFIQQHTQCD
jgi:hypothetical protein